MRSRVSFTAIVAVSILLAAGAARAGSAGALDPYAMQEVFCRFPFAQVVPLDTLGGWGVMYADSYGKLHLLRATPRGWKLEWELTNLGTKIRKFFIRDLNADGYPEIIVATVNGRILVYSMGNYQVLWENLEDRFTAITAIEIANVDSDPQLELVYVADKRLYVVDGVSKSRQWTSDREFDAAEVVVDNVDKDAQPEIILNTGIVIDSRFLNVEVEWDKSFGDRIVTFDMNNDGYPEVIGEFADYSLRVFDVYARREVW